MLALGGLTGAVLAQGFAQRLWRHPRIDALHAARFAAVPALADVWARDDGPTVTATVTTLGRRWSRCSSTPPSTAAAPYPPPPPSR
jgi:hypothetical protein